MKKKVMIFCAFFLTLLLVGIAISIYVVPMHIPRDLAKIEFENKYLITIDVSSLGILEYYLVQKNNIKLNVPEQLVLFGNSPDKKLSDRFFLRHSNPTFCMNGYFKEDTFAMQYMTPDKIRVLYVKEWRVLKPSRVLTLIDYYSPWEKERDLHVYYEIINKKMRF